MSGRDIEGEVDKTPSKNVRVTGWKTGLLSVFVAALLTIGALGPKITVYTIGDSTMAPYALDNPRSQRGWGQVLQQFFTDDVQIIDAARGGRSSKSYYDEGLWKKVISEVQPGDYVFIQFAHNDQKTDTAFHTEPWGEYTEYLKRYVSQTREKGGIPVLFTPNVRRYFDSTGHITPRGQHNMGPGDSVGNYPSAMRAVAKEMGVPLIDLTRNTKALVETYGPERSKELYISTDKTHETILGATLVARLAVDGLLEEHLDLGRYVDTSAAVFQHE